MKRILGFIAIFSVIVSATIIYAGSSAVGTVYVVKNSNGSGYFFGTCNGARNSSDRYQNIGCNVMSNKTVSCNATNADGDYAYASSTNADFIEMAKSLSDFSYLYVAFNSSGEITKMNIAKRSQYLPAH